ncbi:MAG TPA: asparaginase [Pyrinomonadaceae bacterium]|nr:asparaginase [Pyrinomonadaceae bacterium]
MSSEILAKVIRGETVESVHRGHFIILDGERNVIASAGDPETTTYFRSSCKPLQAIPVITSGAADAFEFSDAEIAMACASHSGEPMHVRAVTQMLAKTGLSEPFLRCGSHLPFNEKEAERMLREHELPTQLHNNCSGKHAAMLALAKHIEADLTTYEELDHPVQQAIIETMATFTSIPHDDIATGVDGCAAPNFAVPIVAMAASFLKLIAPPDEFDESVRSACGRIVSAMLQFPELIGGTERLDTMLMQAAPGRLISKVGADGVWLCGVLPGDDYPTGLGIALKIEDGDDKRARPVVAVELLRQLGVLNDEGLSDVSPMAIRNRRGDAVGQVVACPSV